MVVANLLPAGGIFVVGVLHRDFLEHLHEEHVDSGVAFDELLEFLQHRNKLLGILLGLLDLAAQPFLVDTVVGWQPGAGLVHMFVMGDIVVVAVLMNHNGQIGETVVK